MIFSDLYPKLGEGLVRQIVTCSLGADDNELGVAEVSEPAGLALSMAGGFIQVIPREQILLLIHKLRDVFEQYDEGEDYLTEHPLTVVLIDFKYATCNVWSSFMRLDTGQMCEALPVQGAIFLTVDCGILWRTLKRELENAAGDRKNPNRPVTKET